MSFLKTEAKGFYAEATWYGVDAQHNMIETDVVPVDSATGELMHTGHFRVDTTNAATLGCLKVAIDFDQGAGTDPRDGTPRPGGMIQFYETSVPGEPVAFKHGTHFRHEYSLWHQQFADLMAYAVSRGAAIVYA